MALQLNRTTAESLFIQFSALYQAAYEAVPTFYDKIATIMPSGTSTNLYHWIAQIPGMRQWLGSRVTNAAVLRDYSLTNVPYESTISLDKHKVADDQYGSFGSVVQAQGQAVARWPDERIAAAVEAGTTTLCYDGVYFFNDSHPVSLEDSSLSTFSNNLTGASKVLATDPLGVWQAGSEAMANFKGESNKPLGLIADTMMVGPLDKRWAIQAAHAEIVPQTFSASAAATTTIAVAGVSNVYQGDFTVIVNPYLTTRATYIMCLNRPVKPFIWQLREAPKFVPLVDPTLPNMFYQKEFVYGSEGRAAEGYSLPFLAVRCAAS
jgi:phage major head subunit gpT-like protein